MSPTIIERERGPTIAGTRITVYTILDFLQAGWHHTAIAAQFRISSGEVLAAQKYIEEHKDAVMAEYQKILERSARGNPPELQAKLDASHEKFLEMVRRMKGSSNGQGEQHVTATSGGQ